MMIVVALSFLVSWSPFYLTTFVSQVQEISFLNKANFITCMLMTHLLGFINSVVNPVIYNIMNDKFRRSFTCILSRLLPFINQSETEPLVVYNAANCDSEARKMDKMKKEIQMLTPQATLDRTPVSPIVPPTL